LRLGTGPRLLTRPELRTYDTRVPLERRHLSVSLMCLHDSLAQAAGLGIRFYRLASRIVPLLSWRELGAFRRQLEECEALAHLVGDEARATGVRLTVHPALDVLLGSGDDEVVRRGIAAATAWAELMAAMGLGPESCVVVHLGGEGREEAAVAAFARAVVELPDEVRRRLALENDERFCSLQMALSLHRLTGVPVVWDYLHWRWRSPLGARAREAYLAAAGTWEAGIPPKVHFSSPRTAAVGRGQPLARAHADFIDPFSFLDFLRELGHDCDVMLEARAKDLALLKLRADLEGLGCGHLLCEDVGVALSACLA
jgi:UV DNA damage endonuclease